MGASTLTQLWNHAYASQGIPTISARPAARRVAWIVDHVRTWRAFIELKVNPRAWLVTELGLQRSRYGCYLRMVSSSSHSRGIRTVSFRACASSVPNDRRPGSALSCATIEENRSSPLHGGIARPCLHTRDVPLGRRRHHARHRHARHRRRDARVRQVPGPTLGRMRRAIGPAEWLSGT